MKHFYMILFCIVFFCGVIQGAEFPYDLVYSKSVQRNVEYSYIEKLPNGNFLLAGREPSSGYISKPIFTTVTPNGDVVSSKTVEKKLPTVADTAFSNATITKYKDKYIIHGGTATYIYGKIMLVDSNFEPLWAYTREGGDYSYKYVYGYNDKIYTVYRDGRNDTYSLELFDMNGNRTYVNSISPSSSKDFSIDKIIWLEDETFILSGGMKKNGQISLITMKYSIKGNRIWEQEIPLNFSTNSVTLSSCAVDMVRLKNGNIAIFARGNRGSYTAPYIQSVYIYSQNGQLLKTIVLSDQYKLFKIRELEDNTLLLLGSRDNTQELYLENISVDGTVNYSRSNVANCYPDFSNILVDGSDIYIISYTPMSNMDIAHNVLTKLSLKPPTITLSSTTTKIGDNTPCSLNLSLSQNGNSISAIKILDTSNRQYYNGSPTNNISITVNEGNTTINAQVIGMNGEILATSNILTIDKRNLLNQAFGIASLQNGLQKMIILDDNDRYYEDNAANQQLVSQLKGTLDGIFIISNDVSNVLTPLLEN